MKKTSLSFFALTLIATHSVAHEEHSNLPQTSLDMMAASTYRFDRAVDIGDPWMIPGAQLGGEAVPADKGFSLDDLQLLGHYNVDDTYSFSVKLSAHSHSDDHSIDVENAWLTWNAEKFLARSIVEIGRLSTDVTQTATYHSAMSPFSEAPLLSDVFFGRHFNDMGVKFKSTQGLFSLGLEAWSGDAWPAASNEGAGSAYIKMHPTWGNGALNVSAWLMHSQALNRTDDRYGTDHSHGGVTVVSPAASIYFNGDTNMAGLLFSAHQDLGRLRFRLEGEWIQSTSDGDLSDDGNQQSAFESTYDGMRGLFGVSYKNNQFAVQYEELVLENIFLDSVNIVFLEATGLQSEDFNPSKLMLSWQWQFHPDVSFRAEWIDDQSSSEDANGRGAVGLIWHKKLF